MSSIEKIAELTTAIVSAREDVEHLKYKISQVVDGCNSVNASLEFTVNNNKRSYYKCDVSKSELGIILKRILKEKEEELLSLIKEYESL